VSSSTVADREGLLAIFAELAGRRLLGVVDLPGEGLELVFADDGTGGNLVTIFTDGPRAGLVAFGGVAAPASYVAACGVR
jgi:hypothetical protein